MCISTGGCSNGWADGTVMRVRRTALHTRTMATVQWLELFAAAVHIPGLAPALGLLGGLCGMCRRNIFIAA